MKKTIILCVVFCLILCGCSAKRAVANDGQEYIVSAFGFDGGGELKVTLEALVVNSDDLEEDKKTRLISGDGKTCDEALAKINSQITQPLTFGHNGAVVIGKSVTEGQLEEILGFISEKSEINVGTMLISCNNARKLLSSKTVSSAAVGYDIMSMADVEEFVGGLKFKNLFYEVQSARRKPLKTFALPYFEVTEEGLSVSGLSFFNDGGETAFLNMQQSQLSGLITDTARRGEYILSGAGFKTEYSKTTYDFGFDDRLYIYLNIRFKGGIGTETLKAEIEKIFNNVKTNHGDIWGIGNIIYQKNPKIWNKIKEDYEDYFKNSVLKVNVYE